MPPESDSTLIERLHTLGDEGAFRTLYRRHSARMYQLHLRFAGGDVAQAEDLLQETWLRAVRHVGDFRHDGNLAAWLRGIAVNVAREWLRAHRREGLRVVDLDPDELAMEASPHPVAADLEAAIALLPAGYRAVLVLHDVEGFTHADIAEMLGIAPGTSKSQLFEARRAVRRMLADSEQDAECTTGTQ